MVPYNRFPDPGGLHEHQDVLGGDATGEATVVGRLAMPRSGHLCSAVLGLRFLNGRRDRLEGFHGVRVNVRQNGPGPPFACRHD